MKEARRNKPIAADSCILRNNEEMDGHWETTCVGISEKRTDERSVVCRMFTEEKMIRGKTGIEKVFLQVEERHTEEEMLLVGDERKEQAGKMNWS